MVSFAVQSFLVWCSTIFFSFISLAWGDRSKNTVLRLMARTLLLEFLLCCSGLRIQCVCGGSGDCWSMGLILGLVQWVEDLALLQLWCRLQLHLGFDPWPGNFHVLWVRPKKKKKKKELTAYVFFYKCYGFRSYIQVLNSFEFIFGVKE